MFALLSNRILHRSLSVIVGLTLAAASTGSVYAAKDVPTDIFSTPDSLAPPTFSGRNLPAQFTDPLFGPGGDPPGRDALRAIPSMTGKQLATVDQLIFSNRDEITPLQEEVNSLRKLLDQRKKQQLPIAVEAGSVATAPDSLNRGGSMMMMEAPTGPSDKALAYAEEPDEVVKARIDALNQQITATRANLWPSLKGIMSEQQLQQLQSMRFGKLVISSNASTELPEPIPAALQNKVGSPAKHPAPPNPSRPFSVPSLVPHSLVSPVLYTTKQVLYRALWRL
jgi:hypothetical protein